MSERDLNLKRHSDTQLYKFMNGKMKRTKLSMDMLHHYKNNTYFFLIHDSMVPQFKECEKYTYTHPVQPIFHILDDKIYVRFLWECIVLFATQEQLDKFDDFRQDYVNHLLKESCSNKKNKCDIQVFKRVGSRAQKSDIDYNIESLRSYEIIKRIMNIHYKHFQDDIADVFDLNFYGSIINYEINNPPKDYRQTIWSYLRFVEVIKHLSKDNQQFIYNKLPARDKQLYNDTKTHLEKLEKQYTPDQNYNNYEKSIKDYHTNSISPEAYELFSLTKYFERESYRSVGAFLFVVNKSNRITVPMLIDCVYDNIGFISEIAVGVTMCNVGTYGYRLLRLPKYIARSLGAISLLRRKQDIKNTRDIEIDRLVKFCEKVNHKRKQVTNLEDMKYDIRNFITLFTGLRGSKKIDSYMRELEENVGNARIDLLMNIYKKLRRYITKKQ